ncbi:very low-density lipoprotein receptor-like [Anneissia japonica]|uniref:very low-density lipoprotein receptor-like n=1 Tax=Anneissia japonica TaxID=1529436 RepID=UPI0014256009|nr:very low-density lipoprotein receptor-like [Anneissia japonica]
MYIRRVSIIVDMKVKECLLVWLYCLYFTSAYSTISYGTTDFDECKQVNPNVCSQGCNNHDGGYSCYCQDGYDLINQTYCQAIGPDPLILLADRYLVREYDPLLIKHRTISPNLNYAVALDYDIKEMQVYWSDRNEDTIYRTNINGSGLPEVVISGYETYGMCIDWIFRNIYWADRSTKTIHVASLEDLSKRSILIPDITHTPEGLTLDPKIGYMFWSVYSGKIERAGMNGQQRLVLVDTDISSPVGLTTDLTTNLLFWVEQGSYRLNSIDYNGHGRRTILSSYSILPRPFGITVFEDYVYLTDLQRKAIIKANKFNGKHTMLVGNLNHPLGIQIYHPQKQIKGIINHCEGHNGGCSDLCVAAPKLNDNSVKYSCLCPSNSFLLQDGRTCEGSEVNPLTPPSSTVSPPEEKRTTQMRTDNINDEIV